MNESALDKILDKLNNIETRLNVLESQSVDKNSKEDNLQLLRSSSNSQSAVPTISDEAFYKAPKELSQENKFKNMDIKSVDQEYGWMGFLGIFFIVIAAVFFIKLSIDTGWLNPTRQIFLLVITGVFLIFSSKVMTQLTDTAYASMLPATGVVMLHLSWFGAFKIYGLIGPSLSLVMATLVSGICLLIQSKHKNPIFSLVAIAGTYLSVILVGTELDKSLLAAFMLIWNLSFCIAGIYSNERYIISIAAYFAVILVGIFGLAPSASLELPSYIFVQIIQFLTFASAMSFYSIYHKTKMNNEESKHIMVIGAIVYGTIYTWIEKLFPGSGPWVGLALVTVIIGIYKTVELKMNSSLDSKDAVYLMVSGIIFHGLFLDLTPDSIKPIWLIGLIPIINMVLNKDGFRGVKFIFAVLAGWCILITFTEPTSNFIFYNFIYCLMGLFAYLIINTKSVVSIESQYFKLLLFLAHAEFMFGIYKLSLTTEILNSLMVSICWGIYALFILFLGWTKKDSVLAKSSLVILLSSVYKALFHDLSMLSSIHIIISFLFVGVLLYGCGLIYRNMRSW